MKTLVAIVMTVILFSCNPSNQSGNNANLNPENIIEDFENLIENDVEDDNINGSISMAIIHKDSIIVSKSFGKADENTIYRIGSITKSFTGVLLLKLHQEGILNINDPIENYLPEIKNLVDYDKHPSITFVQLASHTSGLDRESRNRDANFGAVNEWESKVLAAIPQTRFRFSPDERFSYSNIGYAILGLAMSQAAGKSYVKLIQEYILEPLEMTNTYFEIPDNKKQYLAKGMAGGPTAELNEKLPLEEHNGRGYRVPNGGLYSTPNDMTTFMKACMGFSEILSDENLKRIQTTQTPTKRLRSNYSFGFDLYEDQGIVTIGHGGSTPGYSAHFEFEKNSMYGIVIMRNYNFGNTNLDLRTNALLRKISLKN